MSACRAYAINELLVKIIGDQVRIQCMALSQAGLSIDEMNEKLATEIIPTVETWREAMLMRIMAVMNDADNADKATTNTVSLSL